MKVILNNIKQIRKDIGISVEQLALLSHLSPSTISDIENGNKIPTQLTMLFICRGLKMDMEKVFIIDYHILDTKHSL